MRAGAEASAGSQGGISDGSGGSGGGAATTFSVSGSPRPICLLPKKSLPD